MSTVDQALEKELEERFTRYVAIDTTSHGASTTTPSTDRQLDFQRIMVDELTAIGLSDVHLTNYGAVIGTIPANINRTSPVIGLLAHVDTTEAFPGDDVMPRVHRAWDGSDITFPENTELVLRSEDSPYLASRVGDDIVTASGRTLLGADDKAGVAIIMAVANRLLTHPEIEHGTIKVCFTPDEEIGRGVHSDLPKDLGAELAYTLDGGDVAEVVYETFSADRGDIQITGVSAHPGDAKDVLVNALTLAAKIIDTLPNARLTPETTGGRQGFLHLVQMEGSAASANMYYIIRDFELDGLESSSRLLEQVCAVVEASEPRSHITCKITPQYRNMRYWLENDMRPVDLARRAVENLGYDLISPPIRGGTDGSRLTEIGVPTPNVFTGMQMIHGPLEWISVQDMARSALFCIELARLWGQESS